MSERGVSPVVGFALLVGLVLVGATVVAVAGVGDIGGLQDDARTEHALSAATSAEHEIATAAFSEQPREIPFGDVAVDDATISDDGDVAITWFNASTQDPGDASDDCTTSVEGIGAIEYAVGDRTIAYQSGGVWRHSDGDTTVHSAPNMDYDGDRLSLGLIQIDEGQVGGSSAVATPDRNRSARLGEEIRATSDCHPTATDVHITITSTYHEGWYTHLEDAFGNDSDDVTVTHHPEDERVEAVLEGLDPMEPASFVVIDDDGIVGSPDQAVEYGDKIKVRTAIENRGESEATQAVSLNIVGSDVTNPSNHKVTIPAGETKETTLEIPFGQYKEKNKDRGLEPNGVYEYRIETEDDETETTGTFYLGDSSTEFELSNATITPDDGSRVLAADLKNVGFDEGETDVKLSLVHHGEDGATEYATDTMTVSRSFGQEEPVSWTINESRLLQGENEFTITGIGEDFNQSKDEVSETFTVTDAGVDPGDTELQFDYNATVNVSVLATETSFGTAWDESDEFDYRENLHPIHASIVTTDQETGVQEEHTPWTNEQNDDDRAYNLNTQNTRERVWTHSMEIESGTALTVRGQSYYCTDPLLDGPGWEHATTESFDGDEESGWSDDDGAGEWGIHDCTNESEPYDEEWYEADASQDVDTPHVRVRDAERNSLPDLRGFHPRQRSADDILEDQGLFGGVDEDGVPYLDLEDNEFVFLFEITTEPSEGQSADEFFQSAVEDDSPGDPNFNDMIVHVEVDQQTPPEEIPNPIENPDAGDADPIDVGTGTSSGRASADDEAIQVESTYIVIE